MSEADELAEIFDAHVSHVFRVLRRFGVMEDDVEDVAQEVFLVVHRRAAEREGGAAFRTWLYGICRRCAAAYRRRAHRRREIPSARVPEQETAALQDEAVDHRRALALLDAVLGELPDEQREVYVLFELESLAMADVAEALECPLKTAYARLYAARTAVRAALRARDRSVA